MFSLEQVKLLESKITRAVNFVAQVTEENKQLQKRNDELEETIAALREEKTRVEEGIISALGKLNQFEDAIEQSLSSVKAAPKPVQKESTPQPKASALAAAVKPAVPSAYTVEEEDDGETLGEETLDEIEDSGEAELDIF